MVDEVKASAQHRSAPMTDNRETLADRVEALDGPCREVDCWAHLAANPEIEVMTNGGNHKGEGVEYTLATALIAGWEDDWGGFATQIGAPHYTGSLDAAMTLGDEATMVQAIREAFPYVQAIGWPEGGFVGALARATAAAALRAQGSSDHG